MDWQEIMEKAIEINELQQILSSKANSLIINKIIDRNNKYANNLILNLKTLNNGLLEHQVSITPYQIIILKKINEMSLDANSQSIYINLPETQEEAEKYILELENKYNLANKCFDLVINLESISTIENDSEYNYENSIYAKILEIKINIFIDIINNINKNRENVEEHKKLIESNIKKLNLSKEEKKKLYIETFTLSYDRNAFEYIYVQKKLLNHFNIIDSVKNLNKYFNYKNLLNTVMCIPFVEMSLQEIYDEFKIIYETDLVKQKINKK